MAKDGPFAAATVLSALITIKDMGQALDLNSSREGPEHLVTAVVGWCPH